MPKKILIGEDELPMARVLELKLKNSGYETRAVFNGEDVIKELKKSKFDILLLDLVMPKKDGFEVLEYLQKSKNKMPIIVLSNLSQQEDKSRVLELGAKEFFVKADTPLSEIVKNVKKIIK